MLAATLHQQSGLIEKAIAIQANQSAFMAIKDDGKVIVWAGSVQDSAYPTQFSMF